MTYQLNMAAVVDHILTLQQSLAHNERMLNKSHPMYTQNLHFELLRTRTKMEFAMFLLALLTVMDLPPSMVVGTYDLRLFVSPAK
jgi:Mg2+ and Co2+ transporter CorA